MKILRASKQFQPYLHKPITCRSCQGQFEIGIEDVHERIKPAITFSLMFPEKHPFETQPSDPFYLPSCICPCCGAQVNLETPPPGYTIPSLY